MNILEEQIRKIYKFVSCEFNINDEAQLNKVKEDMSLEKIKTLNVMLKDYKKSVKKAINAKKRKEKQKEAQKNYKNLQTNLKIEEFEKYENDAKLKNLTISEYLKIALEQFLSLKTVKHDTLPIERELNTLKGKYNTLKADYNSLNTKYRTLEYEDQNKHIQNESSLTDSLYVYVIVTCVALAIYGAFEIVTKIIN